MKIAPLEWRAPSNEELARHAGRPAVDPEYARLVVIAACMGQMEATREQATRAGKLFGLGKEEVLLLQEVPCRGPLPRSHRPTRWSTASTS